MDESKKKLIQSNFNLLDHDLRTMKEIIEKHEAVRERAIQHIYQFVTALGVVAGFGFTAVALVESIYLFIAGELFLFIAMVIAMRFIKRAFIDEADLYAGYINDIGKVMDERMNIPIDETTENIVSRMDRIAQKELMIFNSKSTKIKSDCIFNAILVLFVLGGIFLLFSFMSSYKIL